MKLLPYLALLIGAFFVTFGIREVFQLKDQIEPFGLLFPILWDITMVLIGLGIVFRCNCARKAGVAWCAFCIAASLMVGVAAALWISHPRSEAFSPDRLFFMILAIVFGILFGVWQWRVLRSTSHQEWLDTRDSHRSKPGQDGHHPA